MSTVRIYIFISFYISTIKYLTTIVQCHDLVIEPSEPRYFVQKFSGLTFRCKSSTYSLDELEWVDNLKIRIKTGEKLNRIQAEKDEDSLLLILPNMHMYDSGNYNCTVRKQNTTQVAVNIQVYVPVTFVNTPNYQMLENGTNGFIRCNLTSDPFAEVVWKVKGDVIVDDPKYQISIGGLTVRNVNWNDVGMYECQGRLPNFNHSNSKFINVTVQYRPILTEGLPSNIEGIAGLDFSISCQGRSDPPPVYAFYLNDELMEESADPRININSAEGVLYYSPLSKEDAGQIKCVISNDVNSISSTGVLTILTLPNISKFDNVSCAVGVVCVLSCVADGDPEPMVVITRKGQPSKQGSEKLSRFDLRIDRMSREDSDIYVCTATSKAGVISREIVLHVEFGPIDPLRTTQRLWGWGDMNPWRKVLRQISCVVEANPPPTFNLIVLPEFRSPFTSDEYDVQNGSEFYTMHHIRKGYLSILLLQVDIKFSKNHELLGEYICTASNKYSSINITLNISKLGIPFKPELELLKTYPGEMLFLVARSPMKPYHGNTESSFFFAYKLANETTYDIQVFKFIRNSNDSKARVRGLVANSHYNFIVGAINLAGIGPRQDKFFNTTPPSRPEPLELISQMQSMKHNEYILVWDEPIDVGLNITKYTIKYREALVNDDNEFIEPLDDWTIKTITQKQHIIEQKELLEEFTRDYVPKVIEEKVPAKNLSISLSSLEQLPYKLPPRDQLLELLRREKYHPEAAEESLFNLIPLEMASHRSEKKPIKNDIDFIKEQARDQIYEEPIHFMYKLSGLVGGTSYQVEVVCANDLGISQPNQRFIFRTADAPKSDKSDKSAASITTKNSLDNIIPHDYIGQPLETVSEKTTYGGAQSSSHIIIPIVVIFIFILFFVVMDVTCYFTRGCSVTMTLFRHLFGKEPSRRKPNHAQMEKDLNGNTSLNAEKIDESSLLMTEAGFKPDPSPNKSGHPTTINKSHINS